MLRDQIEGKNDSWAIRWYASAFLNEKLTLYPGTSMISNIGHDDSGIHSGKSNVFDVVLRDTDITLRRIPLREDAELRRKIEKYFSAISARGIRKIVKKIADLFSRK